MLVVWHRVDGLYSQDGRPDQLEIASLILTLDVNTQRGSELVQLLGRDNTATPWSALCTSSFGYTNLVGNKITSQDFVFLRPCFLVNSTTCAVEQ